MIFFPKIDSFRVNYCYTDYFLELATTIQNFSPFPWPMLRMSEENCTASHKYMQLIIINEKNNEKSFAILFDK